MPPDLAAVTMSMAEREPTFADLLRDLWQARLYLLAGLAAGVIAAFAFLAAAVPHYRADMLVAPSGRGTGPDIKALLPDNSSFAVQYMLSAIGSADSGDFARYEQMLRGISVARALIDEPGLRDALNASARFRIGGGAPAIQTAEELAAYLEDRVTVEPVANTALRRLVYQHPDREFAARLLATLHETADGLIRAEIKGRTRQREAYLQEALAAVAHPDHRRALTALLMEQEHVRMILAMGEPFAAIIAEPAAAGTRPDWPRKAMILPAFVLIGLFLGFAFYHLRRALRA